MKRYLVDYWVRHKKEFWMQNEKQITDFLSDDNECKIVSIEEVEEIKVE